MYIYSTVQAQGFACANLSQATKFNKSQQAADSCEETLKHDVQ